MFSKKKSAEKLDPHQHELIERAQKRIKQKKKLYNHFVIYLIGSVFLIIVNKVLKYGEQYDWFVWAITLWTFFFLVHLYNVFITHRFMGKDWERSQRDRLISLQKEKIAKLQKQIEAEFPAPSPRSNYTEQNDNDL